MRGAMIFRVDTGLDPLPAAGVPVPLHTQLLRSSSCLCRASAKVAVSGEERDVKHL